MKSLGFTVVGGKDSPKGSIGIYVKSVFPNGQAVGLLKEGERSCFQFRACLLTDHLSFLLHVCFHRSSPSFFSGITY